jgi:hypothetical protein
MTFHLSRFSPYTQKLFSGQEKKLNRKRTPIAARAKQLVKYGAIPPGKIKEACTQPLFSLAGTNFELRGRHDDRSREIATKVISSFGPAFRGSHIKIETFGEDIYTVTVTPYCHGEAFLTVDFDIAKTERSMHLGEITSHRPGSGGKGVAALFNTAKSEGIENINFVVTPDNIAAQQFYYHTDFGAPETENKRSWTVKVR